MSPIFARGNKGEGRMNKRIIDLRSDTVTRPSDEMRKAMAEAIVGDDVLGDDPTVKRLEERVADLLGKKAALFFPSGTMSNQTAIAVHTRPGDEIICEEDAHLFIYESAAPAAISHVLIRSIPGKRGVIYAEQIRKKIRPRGGYNPRTGLICLENTHNRAGGSVFPLAVMENIYRMAKSENIPVHLDGARLFNASVASRVPLARYAACADTVNVCLSKGLGAPIGSCLAGDKDTIAEARRVRKRLGGGMRQVGILAAAGLYALENNVNRLAEDHANARKLAEGLAEIKGLEVRPAEAETNIVVIRLSGAPYSPPELSALLAEYGVLMLPLSESSLRAVTHMDVNAKDIDDAVAAFAKILS